jgi:hypothetical protein
MDSQWSFSRVRVLISPSISPSRYKCGRNDLSFTTLMKNDSRLSWVGSGERNFRFCALANLSIARLQIVVCEREVRLLGATKRRRLHRLHCMNKSTCYWHRRGGWAHTNSLISPRVWNNRAAAELQSVSRREWGWNFYCFVSKWPFVHQEVGNKNQALILGRDTLLDTSCVLDLFPTVCYLGHSQLKVFKKINNISLNFKQTFRN